MLLDFIIVIVTGYMYKGSEEWVYTKWLDRGNEGYFQERGRMRALKRRQIAPPCLDVLLKTIAVFSSWIGWRGGRGGGGKEYCSQLISFSSFFTVGGGGAYVYWWQ